MCLDEPGGDLVDWDEVAAIVDKADRPVASKRLVDRLDGHCEGHPLVGAASTLVSP